MLAQVQLTRPIPQQPGEASPVDSFEAKLRRLLTQREHQIFDHVEFTDRLEEIRRCLNFPNPEIGTQKCTTRAALPRLRAVVAAPPRPKVSRTTGGTCRSTGMRACTPRRRVRAATGRGRRASPARAPPRAPRRARSGAAACAAPP
eukprot:6204150-Pleurochrysis_carterae.AAC.4